MLKFKKDAIVILTIDVETNYSHQKVYHTQGTQYLVCFDLFYPDSTGTIQDLSTGIYYFSFDDLTKHLVLLNDWRNSQLDELLR